MQLQIQYNTYMNKKVTFEQPQNTFSFFLRVRTKKNFRNISLTDVLSFILLRIFVKNSPPAEKNCSASTEVGEIIILLVLHTTEYAIYHDSERNH